ncbi:unnamed protein product, partial [Mesorhabditis spiculigera]
MMLILVVFALACSLLADTTPPPMDLKPPDFVGSIGGSPVIGMFYGNSDTPLKEDSVAKDTENDPLKKLLPKM